jgi:SAM-dependent methyltransferase
MKFHPMSVNINTQIRWQVLRSIPEILDLKGKRVLDIGCGLGFFSVRFAQAGAQVWATDVDKGALEYLSGEYKIRTQVLDVEKDPFPSGGFDLVFIGEVLEHVVDFRNVMDKIRSSLNPNGLLLLTTPALEGWLITSAGKRLAHTEGSEKHERDGFTYDELTGLCTENRFEVVCHLYTIYSLAELFMQMTKKNYLKAKKSYGSQLDVLALSTDIRYRTLKMLLPILLPVFYFEQWLSSKIGLKGHCHVLVARKNS